MACILWLKTVAGTPTITTGWKGGKEGEKKEGCREDGKEGEGKAGRKEGRKEGE